MSNTLKNALASLCRDLLDARLLGEGIAFSEDQKNSEFPIEKSGLNKRDTHNEEGIPYAFIDFTLLESIAKSTEEIASAPAEKPIPTELTPEEYALINFPLVASIAKSTTASTALEQAKVAIAKKHKTLPLTDSSGRVIKNTESIFADAATSPYPANTAKALWNIATRMLTILNAGAGRYASFRANTLINEDTGFLEQNFSYLDADTWVLHVIDPKTLQIANIFKKFLATLIKDPTAFDVIPNIPLMGEKIAAFKKEAKTKLIGMLDILNDQITHYEAALPETQKATSEVRKKYRAQREKILDLVKPYKTILSFNGEATKLTEPLKMGEYETTEYQLTEITTKIYELNTAISQFNQLNPVETTQKLQKIAEEIKNDPTLPPNVYSYQGNCASAYFQSIMPETSVYVAEPIKPDLIETCDRQQTYLTKNFSADQLAEYKTSLNTLHEPYTIFQNLIERLQPLDNALAADQWQADYAILNSTKTEEIVAVQAQGSILNDQSLHTQPIPDSENSIKQVITNLEAEITALDQKISPYSAVMNAAIQGKAQLEQEKTSMEERNQLTRLTTIAATNLEQQPALKASAIAIYKKHLRLTQKIINNSEAQIAPLQDQRQQLTKQLQAEQAKLIRLQAQGNLSATNILLHQTTAEIKEHFVAIQHSSQQIRRLEATKLDLELRITKIKAPLEPDIDNLNKLTALIDTLTQQITTNESTLAELPNKISYLESTRTIISSDPNTSDIPFDQFDLAALAQNLEWDNTTSKKWEAIALQQQNKTNEYWITTVFKSTVNWFARSNKAILTDEINTQLEKLIEEQKNLTQKITENKNNFQKKQEIQKKLALATERLTELDQTLEISKQSLKAAKTKHAELLTLDRGYKEEIKKIIQADKLVTQLDAFANKFTDLTKEFEAFKTKEDFEKTLKSFAWDNEQDFAEQDFKLQNAEKALQKRETRHGDLEARLTTYTAELKQFAQTNALAENNMPSVISAHQKTLALPENAIFKTDFKTLFNSNKDAFATARAERSKQQELATLKSERQRLYEEYFGMANIPTNKPSQSGKAIRYLKERAAEYVIKDALRTLFAMFVGCFGYKPDSVLRQEYLENTLKPALSNYIQSASSTNLIKTIVAGQRITKNNPESSLYKLLDKLKDHVTTLDQQYNALNPQQNAAPKLLSS